MLFASTELAARIEAAEARLVAEGTRAMQPAPGEPAPLVLEVGGGLATLARPGSPLNKWAGLGFAPTPSDEQLDALERAFDERGEALQAELSILGEAGLAARLAGRGYVLQGFENVLGRALPGAGLRSPSASIEVVRDAGADCEPWLDVVVDGFAAPDTQGVASHESFPRELLAQVIGDMARGGSTERYLARLDGELAGGASMRLDAGIAQLCGAATRPAMRRRGVQSALLSARLERASAAGCELAILVCQPGSKSHQNAQKNGFELLYTRAILVREPRPTE